MNAWFIVINKFGGKNETKIQFLDWVMENNKELSNFVSAFCFGFVSRSASRIRMDRRASDLYVEECIPKSNEMKGIEKHVRYPQPHNIQIYAENAALERHLILKEHGRLKYEAKHKKSKQSKRYDGR